MTCPESQTTLKYLRGELSEGQSRKSLEHVRACRSCRATMRFGAETLSALQDAQAPAQPFPFESEFREPAPRPRRSIGGLFGRTPGRPANRILLMLICCVGAVVFLRQPSAITAAEPPSVEDRARDLLGVGTPLCVAPLGEQEGRPRVVSGLVPPATGSGRLLVLDARGNTIYDEPWTPGEGGCSLSESRFFAKSGEFGAGRLVIPFPAEDRLAIEPGRSYGVALALPGGHLSASSVFTVAADPGH